MTIRTTWACALTALVLTACGGADSTGTATPDRLAPPEAFAAVVDRQSAEQPTSRLTTTTRVTGSGLEQVITTSGVVDPARGTAQLELALPGLGTLQQRILDGTVYVSVPQRPGTWFSLRLADLVGTGLGFGDDPSSDLLAQLRSAATDVELVGPSELEGMPTTLYRGSVDVAASTGALGGALGQLAGQLQDATCTFQAHVDEDGRLRRVETDASFTVPGTTGPVRAETTLDLTDYGTVVDVQAPPAEQVQDGGPLLDVLMSSLGS